MVDVKKVNEVNKRAGKSLKQKAKDFLASDSSSANATNITLAILGVVGILAVGAVAPNVVQLLKHYPGFKRHSPKQFQKAYYGLKRRGLIEIKTNRHGKTYVRLTKKGEHKLESIDVDELTITKPKKWDGKWRVLMFDLPVRFKKAREAFRWKIKDLGFWQLQKSVWIYPYPCEDELIFVAETFGVTAHIEILTVEKVLRAEELKRHFGL